MKNKTLICTLSRLILFVFVISISFFAGCSDDPQATNEEEVITTFIVTIVRDTTKHVVGDTVILSWDDSNLDAIVDASEVTTSGSLQINKKYTAKIQLLNKSVNPAIHIEDEIKEENEEHIFCFTVTNVKISISNLDKDRNGLPVGLTSTWTTTTTSTGTVTILLRHQPGVKTGDCPGVGDTDASITFNVEIGAE